MKKFLTSFADSILSREQMKKVKGGYDTQPSYCTTGENASCYQDVNDAWLACYYEPTCYGLEAVWP